MIADFPIKSAFKQTSWLLRCSRLEKILLQNLHWKQNGMSKIKSECCFNNNAFKILYTYLVR